MAAEGGLPKLDTERTAILFIEYQNEFTSEGGKMYPAVKDSMEQTNMLENSKKLAEAARSAGCTIMHAPIAFAKGHRGIAKTTVGVLANIKGGEAFAEGEWGSAFCEGMEPQENDVVVQGKSGLCAFSSTNLNFLLTQCDIKHLVIAGFLTNCCVESTMRTAYENGFKVYTLKDGCAATSVAAHDAVFEHNFGMFSTPTTTEEVIKAITA